MPSNRRTEPQHGTVALERKEGTLTRIPRILLADDRKEMLQEINLILKEEFMVVGTVEDGLRAVELTTILHPDVLVLDISMPVVNGIEAAFCLKRLASRVRIIFLTVQADPEFVETALSAGAFGYVLKTFMVTDLVPAIRAAMHGDIFVSPSMQLQ